jgi:UDP-glucose 4-epimerase
LGPGYSHGHVFDFINKLLKNPNKLKILGDGKQRKSYLHVFDVIDAIKIALKKSNKKVNIFNLGHNNYINVDKSIYIIEMLMNLKPKRFYTGGKSGWVGDLPFVFLDNKKIKSLSWEPKITIENAIADTAKWLLDNKWIFKKRK